MVDANTYFYHAPWPKYELTQLKPFLICQKVLDKFRKVSHKQNDCSVEASKGAPPRQN
jgi:hypothetical protein